MKAPVFYGVIALAVGIFIGMLFGRETTRSAVLELNCHHRAATYSQHTPIAVVDGICAEIWGTGHDVANTYQN